ncbi:MAG TPA: type I-F CRISPR-associated endonuclease Cas1f, partial [Pseudomonadales bacterium]|nr:type I-F CRISPR-associated endonuclease Cas1f [Pseudomonadales bacterium]
EVDVEVAWLTPQSEYRPTEYLQQWVRFWFDDDLRLQAAKLIQNARLSFLEKHWLTNRRFKDAGFIVDSAHIKQALEKSREAISVCADTMSLLTEEARLTKYLYKIAANALQYGDFTRAKRGSGVDPANRFLDHGNYLAYGLGATATWVIGLPHGLAVLHGKTRRGGLVFDVADLVKDALILPQAFISAAIGDEEQAFRQACIDNLTRSEALDFMIETIQDIAQQLGGTRA